MQLNNLPGALDYEECLVLESLVRCTGARCIVETGCGMSTHYLAKGLGVVGTDGKVYIFEKDSAKIETVKDALGSACLLSFCEFIEGDSLKTLKRLRTDFPFVDLAFIDSEHEYDHVLQELKLVYKNLKPNGLIIGHDSQHDPGASRAYQTFISSYGLSSVQILSPRGVVIIQ